MKKTEIMTILVLIVLVGFLLFIAIGKLITGSVIQENQRMYTKAICNETNFCQDYYVICQGKELISKNPITGATIQHSEN